jgi:hypothetical protein
VVKKVLRIAAIAAGVLALGMTGAAAQGFDPEPNVPLAIEGRGATTLLEPILHAHAGGIEYSLPTPPDQPVTPSAVRPGPVSGGGDNVLRSDVVGTGLIGPRGTGSIYTQRQSADREIKRLIRELDG